MSDFRNENDIVPMASTVFLSEAVASVKAVKTGIDGIRRGLAAAGRIPADKRSTAQQMAGTMADLFKHVGELMDLLTEAGHMLASRLEPPIDPSTLN